MTSQVNNVVDRPVGAAVVGASGFLGSALTAGLSHAGIPVVPVTRGAPAVVDGEVAPALRTVGTVFYVATSVTPGSAERFPARAEADAAHFEGFLAALGRLRTTPAVVLAGSADCYDRDARPPFTEDSPVRPETVYSRGKWEMEQMLGKTAGVRPSVVRLASLYGPGHRTVPGHGVVAHWLTSVANGQALRQIGDDETTRDFVYVTDVVDALVRLHHRLATAGADVPFALNIGSGEGMSLGRLRREVAEVTGIEPEVRRARSREFDRKTLVVDATLAADVLGWRPTTSFAEGLRRTWNAVLGARTTTRQV